MLYIRLTGVKFFDLSCEVLIALGTWTHKSTLAEIINQSATLNDIPIIDP